MQFVDEHCIEGRVEELEDDVKALKDEVKQLKWLEKDEEVEIQMLEQHLSIGDVCHRFCEDVPPKKKLELPPMQPKFNLRLSRVEVCYRFCEDVWEPSVNMECPADAPCRKWVIADGRDESFDTCGENSLTCCGVPPKMELEPPKMEPIKVKMELG